MKHDALILGIGNPLLCDDTLGLRVLADLQTSFTGCDFKACYAVSFDTMDEISEYRQLILIDSLVHASLPAGSIVPLPLLPPREAEECSAAFTHGVNLPMLWELCRRLGYSLPERSLVLGIVGSDFVTFSENPSAAITACYAEILGALRQHIRQFLLGAYGTPYRQPQYCRRPA